MTELKFRLKKDGKCVGYMRVAPWGAAPMQVAWLDTADKSAQWSPVCNIVFDSLHDFVCLDRNGLEVYSGDLVKEDGRHWRVKWDEADLGWCLRDLAGEKPSQIPDPHTIELIPEEATDA